MTLKKPSETLFTTLSITQVKRTDINCGSRIESQSKQKRSKALPLGESMTSEAHPIAFGVGG